MRDARCAKGTGDCCSCRMSKSDSNLKKFQSHFGTSEMCLHGAKCPISFLHVEK
jgi:hypothetical protein